jgi:hypothetical protein
MHTMPWWIQYMLGMRFVLDIRRGMPRPYISIFRHSLVYMENELI